MQSLVGGRSHSLSARLGKSSTEYSSPSKDINTINGHLSGRKYPFQLAASQPASIALQRHDSNAVRCSLTCPPHSIASCPEENGLLWQHGLLPEMLNELYKVSMHPTTRAVR